VKYVRDGGIGGKDDRMRMNGVGVEIYYRGERT
jgi:hypothetical protein